MDQFHKAYNARHSDPTEVAESFIWSENFQKLTQNNHSIILGARGCGKTTLMKMLTTPALYAWENDKKAEGIRKNISFYGIYISTDIYWDVKNQTYGDQLKDYGSFSERLSHFSVNSNVFLSICETFINVINIELDDQDELKEVELCNNLIKAWKLPPTIPKLNYIKDALNERVDFVNQLIQDVIFNHNPKDQISLPDYFNLNFESSLEQIIPKFERIYNLEKGKKKWALCFDELEFAPMWLQKKLFTSLRSRKQYILYKLSSSPILTSDLADSLLGEYSATVGNDVQLIKMWASKDAEKFSKKIIQSYLKSEQDPSVVFGTNSIYNKESDSYVEGSEFYGELISLINKDVVFEHFLRAKKVDVTNPIPINDRQKDVLHRKIKPVVYHRNYFIESNRFSEKPSYRSRKKTISLYSGIEVLSKICDGNPRWLMGIIHQMNINSDDNKIGKEVQYNEILSASKRFKNVMANIPIGNNNLSIDVIIDRVGKHFRDQILGNEFYLDPKGTFIVDKEGDKLHDNIIELIEKGVSQGAFVLLDYEDDSFDFEIRGRRFRLSYLFFILYDIPLRSYLPLRLSKCLSGAKDVEYNQGSLFN